MRCNQLNVGVIACSSIARRRFLPAVASLESLKIWRIGSRDIQKAKNFAEMFSAPHFGTYEDVLNDKSIDIVYISTPPHNHFQLTLKALEAKKHVICEKPITSNLSDLMRLHHIAQQNNLLFAEHYSFLDHPQHATVKNLIEDNKVGIVKKFRGHYHYPLPNQHDIRLNNTIFGGVSNDSLGYPILAGLFFIDGEPKLNYAQITIDKNFNVDSSCEFSINIGETEITGKVAMGSEYLSSYEVCGTNGSISVDRAYSVDGDHIATVTLLTEGKKTQFKERQVNQIELFLNKFQKNIYQLEEYKDSGYFNKFYRNSYRLRLILDEINNKYFNFTS